MKRFTTIALLLAAMSTAPVVAQEAVQVSLRLHPPDIPYHRTAELILEVSAPETLELQLPELVWEEEGLNIAMQPVRQESDKAGRVHWTQSWTLDAVHSRNYIVPAMAVRWGEGESIDTPPLVLRVRDLTESELSLATHYEDIILPSRIDTPNALPGWLIPGSIIGLVVLLGALLYFRRDHAQLQALTPPAPDPWDVALHRLSELLGRALPESGKFEAYYVDLSAILRYYIEDRFHLRAPEQTTPEFLESAGRSGELDHAQQAFLAQFLRHCDRVKFARYQPNMEQMEEGFEDVERFVRETIPKAVPEPTEEAAS